jgi:DNA modification methylase
MKIDPSRNTIICGDNLEWLYWIPDESVQTCYIDPPFFSNANYEKIWGNGWEVASFKDRFAGGIEHYIAWIKERIILIHKKLKKTGVIFLHCDWHASHRLRVLLDEVFGEENFVNEIIWSYQRWTAASNAFQRTHDNILFYAKGANFKFKILTEDYSIKSKHRQSRYSTKIKGKLEQVYTNDSTRKKSMRDVWEISVLNSQAKERIGYRTQKPEILIQRIIESSSDKGDVILDCFAGGFTTAKVCADLQRIFICGDVSPVACKIGMKRLHKHNFFDYESKSLPQTEEEFREMDGHIFAKSICEFMGWKCNPKKSNDKGIDGWDGYGDPIQIKNQRAKTGEKDIRNFLGTLHSVKKKTGIFVAWGFTSDAREFVAKHKKEFDIHLRECRELIGDLLISSEKRVEIEQLFKNILPEDWEDVA